MADFGGLWTNIRRIPPKQVSGRNMTSSKTKFDTDIKHRSCAVQHGPLEFVIFFRTVTGLKLRLLRDTRRVAKRTLSDLLQLVLWQSMLEHE